MSLTWYVLYLRAKAKAASAHRRAVNQRFNDAHVRASMAWGIHVPIEDLRDPHGKRFLFDDIEGMPQQSTLPGEAVSASLKGALRDNGVCPGCMGVCVRERVCVPPCMGCAQIHAH